MLTLFHFIFSTIICSGALYLYGSPVTENVIWFQEIIRELLVNWSSKRKIKLGILSLVTFWKVKFTRGLIIISRFEVVGLRILSSNTNGSAS